MSNITQATANKTSTIGIRKHREWTPGQRNTQHKYNDAIRVNFGCGKPGDTKEWSEFSIMLETEKNDIRIQLTRQEALRMIEHFTQAINNEKTTA